MTLPTQSIGSVPRPQYLIDAFAAHARGEMSAAAFTSVRDKALAETIAALAATQSPIISDGEQTKPSFATYPLEGLDSLAPDGVTIPFADGHVRQLPRLVRGPFKYSLYAGEYVSSARRFTSLPLKQAVIAPSALSLIYPAEGLADYPRDAFIADLVGECEKDIQSCFAAGAATVQLDFTEGRLALALDPGGSLLRTFVDLINAVLDRFSADELERISVHTCPGADHDSTHSAEVDYADLLPLLFQIRARSFMCALAGERDQPRVLSLMRDHMHTRQRVFVGVTDPNDPRIETAGEVAGRIIEAARYIPLHFLGVTDDCGFSPFGDDTSTSREIAFAKIKARIEGVALASHTLGA